MAQKITLCGDDCFSCPRYLARTDEELQAAAELWYRVGWRENIVSNEEISCSGCSSHKSCTYGLLECTGAHGVKKCAQCTAFPCEKIGDMLNSTAEYRERSFALCSPEEFSLLEKAFFQKEINLKK